MNKFFLIPVLLLFLSCKESDSSALTAQEIIDKSIEVSGGNRYNVSQISFDFRNKTYVLEPSNGQRIMKRISKTDSTVIVDVRIPGSFERFVNDSIVVVHDTMAIKYANAINSVHYFAYLPFGLNDRAVKKELLGSAHIKRKDYHKIKITFDQKDGGEDFDDTYVYWFNKETFKPDYLAYEFHVDGGGMRFREAYNERYVDGIRFVDYKNYKPKKRAVSIYKIDRLFQEDELELLSKIELNAILVRQGNYN